MRWGHEGEPALDPAVAQRVRDDRGAALGRLVRLLEG
jgi:hypothetical protein